nr:MAG TPA: hypothetical protein [Caudoviricetes sp.]
MIIRILKPILLRHFYDTNSRLRHFYDTVLHCFAIFCNDLYIIKTAIQCFFQAVSRFLFWRTERDSNHIIALITR